MPVYITGGAEDRIRDPDYDESVKHTDFWNDLTPPAGLQKYNKVAIPPGAQGFMHFQERTRFVGGAWECPSVLHTPHEDFIIYYWFGPIHGSMAILPIPTTDARMWWPRSGYGNGPRLADLDPQPAWVLPYMSFTYNAVGVGTDFACALNGDGSYLSSLEMAALAFANVREVGANSGEHLPFIFDHFASDLGELGFDVPEYFPEDWFEIREGETVGFFLKRPEGLGGESGYEDAPGNPYSSALWRPDELPPDITVVGTSFGGVAERTWTQLSIFPFSLDPDPDEEPPDPENPPPGTVFAGPRISGVVPVRDVNVGTPGPMHVVGGHRPVGQDFNKTQLIALYTAHGAPDPNLVAAIALAESGGYSAAINDANTNGSIDYGLLQINSIHGYDPDQLLNPDYNAEAGKEVSSDWTDFTPWVTYNNGAYLEFL